MNYITLNDEGTRTLYTTRDEAVQREILDALEQDQAYGMSAREEFDIDAISEEAIVWTDGSDTGHRGVGYYCLPSIPEFWEIVEKYGKE